MFQLIAVRLIAPSYPSTEDREQDYLYFSCLVEESSDIEIHLFHCGQSLRFPVRRP